MKPAHPVAPCLALLSVLATVFAPGAWACACGCGIFEIGTGALYPTGTGGKVSSEIDYMDQNQNWSGTSAAPAGNNGDKEIATQFYKLSGEYMFNQSWGMAVEVPFWNRSFNTDQTFGQIPDPGVVSDFQEAALGDIRIMGMFTGLSMNMSTGVMDMSTGVIFGLKLPTGNNSYFNNPDTEIGTGSTDLLLGIYHYGILFRDSDWNWTAEARLDMPFLFQAGYVPGAELDGSLGLNYRGFSVGAVAIVPLAQVAASYRLPDNGTGDPNNSGYERVLLVPGLDVEYGNLKLFTTAGFPVYQNVIGNQLVASYLFKAVLSYSF